MQFSKQLVSQCCCNTSCLFSLLTKSSRNQHPGILTFWKFWKIFWTSESSRNMPPIIEHLETSISMFLFYLIFCLFAHLFIPFFSFYYSFILPYFIHNIFIHSDSQLIKFNLKRYIYLIILFSLLEQGRSYSVP